MANSSYRVSAVFTLKDTASKDKFVEFANSDKGLSVTRAWKGCKSLDMYESRENPNKLVIWQEWESKEDQEGYIKHRHEDGSFDFLGELVACPPEITPIRSMVMQTDEEKIKSIIEDMCHKDHTLGMKHMGDGCVFIRPTGNPLNKEQWNEMMNNPNVSVEDSHLVSVNKLQVCGDMAFACYTAHNKFNYMGKANDDIAVFTSVLQRVGGDWVVVHGQRSSGRSPDDEAPKF